MAVNKTEEIAQNLLTLDRGRSRWETTTSASTTGSWTFWPELEVSGSGIIDHFARELADKRPAAHTEPRGTAPPSGWPSTIQRNRHDARRGDSTY